MIRNKFKHMFGEVFQYLATFFVRFVAKIFWIFPVKKNRVLFCSFIGKQYSCNPKYISDYLKKQYSGEFDIVWALREPNKCTDNSIKAVKFLSLSHFYYFCTAKFVIDNIGFPTYMPKRKSQYLINTWHGGGAYKKCDHQSKKSLRARIALDKYKSKHTDLVLSNCKSFSEKVIPDVVFKYEGKIMRCGMPRNDIFFNDDKSDVKKKVFNELGIESNKIMILYAPTFRGDKNFGLGIGNTWFDTSIDVSHLCDAVKMRFNSDSVFVFRAHHAIITSNISLSYIDATNYPDMQELLCAADILISDYSSSIWDFSLMKKPCFLYVPDMEYYINEDRGVYTPIEEWPGIIAKTNQELQKAIVEFDEDSYRKKVEKHHKDLGSYETGTACEQVCKRIAEVCGIGSD